ncbi:MAG: Bug family tripartite tricarboxylate transporter substrate binding protein [Beijerinckiaceae bacterium]
MAKHGLALMAFGAALAMAGFGNAAAQDWPNKPVTVIVPFAAGGNVDAAARIFSERLGTHFGKQFVIENRTGAGGSTGIGAMAKAAPDGYTLGVVSAGSLFILPHVYKEKLGYDTFRDLKPLALVATQPNFLVVHPSLPVNNAKEFVAHLQANPNKYSYGSSGIGTSQHLCMELIAQKTGIKVAHVPYRASNQIMQDLISGNIHMSCDQVSSALEQVKGGKAKGIAVTSPKAYSLAPDYPAMADTVPGVDVTWSAVFVAPAGVPKEVADKLMQALEKIAADPEIKKRLEGMTVTPVFLAGDALEKQLRTDFDAWKPVVEAAKIPTP